jgi:hypothetical protein
VTAEERAAQQAELKAQIADADDADCRSYGAEQGTPTYTQCRMIKDQQHAQETIARLQVSEAAAQANARQFQCGLGQLGASLTRWPTRASLDIAANC